jgi:hypothetical protein
MARWRRLTANGVFVEPSNLICKRSDIQEERHVKKRTIVEASAAVPGSTVQADAWVLEDAQWDISWA